MFLQVLYEFVQQENLFIFSKSLLLGSVFGLWLGGEERAKMSEKASRVPLTIDRLIQSQWRWILSVPVILLGLLLSNDPEISWTNLLISPNNPEWDWVKPNIVQKFFSSNSYSFIGG